jgi:hypothetical protein
VSWIREIIGTDPDEGIEYLTDTQLADLNAQLADSTTAPGKEKSRAVNLSCCWNLARPGDDRSDPRLLLTSQVSSPSSKKPAQI